MGDDDLFGVLAAVEDGFEGGDRLRAHDVDANDVGVIFDRVEDDHVGSIGVAVILKRWQGDQVREAFLEHLPTKS